MFKIGMRRKNQNEPKPELDQTLYYLNNLYISISKINEPRTYTQNNLKIYENYPKISELLETIHFLSEISKIIHFFLLFQSFSDILASYYANQKSISEK